MPEYETMPCPKCSSVSTHATNERSGALAGRMLVWHCRTCGKVAYGNAAQQLLTQHSSAADQQAAPTRGDK